MQKVTTWDSNAVALIKAACSSPSGVKPLLADPTSTAAGLGFELDPAFEPEIQKLNLALFADDATTDQELADFVHRTIVDGRYVHEWLADPADVARRLGITISPAVVALIKAMDAHLDIDRTVGVTRGLVAANTVQNNCLARKGPDDQSIEPPDPDRF